MKRTLRLTAPFLENIFSNLLKQICCRHAAQNIFFETHSPGVVVLPNGKLERQVITDFEHHRDKLAEAIINEYVDYLIDNGLHTPGTANPEEEVFTPVTKLVKRCP